MGWTSDLLAEGRAAVSSEGTAAARADRRDVARGRRLADGDHAEAARPLLADPTQAADGPRREDRGTDHWPVAGAGRDPVGPRGHDHAAAGQADGRPAV